jgi:hypothetical protein
MDSTFLFEASGLLSFESYGDNVYLNNYLEIGTNLIPSANASLAAEFAYRNYSAKLRSALSLSYRLQLKRNEIRFGILGGLSSLHIGSYSDNSAIAGLEGLLDVRVSRQISIRLKHRSCWYFEENSIYGATFLMGICYSFCKLNTK